MNDWTTCCSVCSWLELKNGCFSPTRSAHHYPCWPQGKADYNVIRQPALSCPTHSVGLVSTSSPHGVGCHVLTKHKRKPGHPRRTCNPRISHSSASMCRTLPGANHAQVLRGFILIQESKCYRKHRTISKMVHPTVCSTPTKIIFTRGNSHV